MLVVFEAISHLTSEEPRMNLHSGARTCPASRALLVGRVRESGWSVTRAATAAGISRRTAHKWLGRYQAEDPASLQDRSSRPRRHPQATPVEWQEMILLLRRTKMTGPQIARDLKRPRATVARVLKRAGLERLRKLEPKEPENRYQHRHPGDLLHFDVKKLGRISGYYGHRITGDRRRQRKGAGWDYVHVAIDDRTRIAYAEVLRDETGVTSAAFLRRAVAWFRTLGIRIRRILTDNGSGYIGRCFAHEVERLRLVHKRTRPYRPRTNGKAERFIQTLIREWAYGVAYLTSEVRARVLPRWLRYYNQRRPHGSLDGLPPLSQLRPRVRTTS
jgi:transposase InsO family protein